MKKKLKLELQIMREQLQSFRHRIMDIRDDEKLSESESECISDVETSLENAESALESL